MSVQEKIVNWLFDTQAIRVCPPDQPFWYTSGAIGPYYVNTHFLYGGEGEANELLALIEACVSDPLAFPARIAEAVHDQYARNQRYHDLCDLVAAWIQPYAFDFISGGERRDFFFSLQAARLLGKPHLSLLKDGTAIWSDAGFGSSHIAEINELTGMRALHIADLITEASSYQRAWLPAVRSCGASMPLTLAIVDRDQGGREYLASEGTGLLALTKIDRQLFMDALAAGLIDEQQFDLIDQFIQNPQNFMADFFKRHPDFLNQQIALGGKNRERALRCLEKGYGQKD